MFWGDCFAAHGRALRNGPRNVTVREGLRGRAAEFAGAVVATMVFRWLLADSSKEP